MIKKFRKKPVVVEAVQFVLGEERLKMVKEDPDYPGQFYIETISGVAYLFPKDWIITEMDGKNYYPCKKDIFEATYEAFCED